MNNNGVVALVVVACVFLLCGVRTGTAMAYPGTARLRLNGLPNTRGDFVTGRLVPRVFSALLRDARQEVLACIFIMMKKAMSDILLGRDERVTDMDSLLFLWLEKDKLMVY